MRSMLVFLLGFSIRAAIIAFFPIIWGGDTILRLFDRQDLMKAHQLPLFQAVIWAVSWISSDPLLVRLAVALIGAYAGLAFYWVAGDLFGPKYALGSALLFITHPFLLALSTVPFQEILMVAGLLSAFHCFYTDRNVWASICLAVACLTRYEAWLACPVFAVAYVWRRGRSRRNLATGCLLFGWLPLVWIATRHGLTSSGHFVVEWPASVWRFSRWLYIGWITAKFTQVSVLALAAAGLWGLWRTRWKLARGFWMQGAYLALFLIAVLFSAHGVMPDPERFVTSREAHVPMCFVLLLAAGGLHQWPKWNRALIALSMALGIAGAIHYVRLETMRPEVQLAYQVAQFLDRSLRENERALILARPIVEEDARLYLDKAMKTGGSLGLREAQRELARFADMPPDYQRVVVYSRTNRGRLLKPGSGCGEWVAVWSEYPDAERELAGAVPVQVFRSGPMSVSIIRRDCSL